MIELVAKKYREFKEHKHSAEITSLSVGFLMALTFSFAMNSGSGLTANHSLDYPIRYISQPECMHLHWDKQDEVCKRELPPISNADYDKYEEDAVVRRYYSVLHGAPYSEGRDRDAGGHLGTDIAAAMGTPIYSIGDGKVISADFNVGYGHNVKIAYLLASGQTIYAIYAHMEGYIVKEGDTVLKGQEIGRVGQSGFSTGPHLHFEINTTSKRGRPYYPYLDCEESDILEQVNHGSCRHLMHEHSTDPIVLLEKNSIVHKEISVASNESIEDIIHDHHGHEHEEDTNNNEDHKHQEDHEEEKSAEIVEPEEIAPVAEKIEEKETVKEEIVAKPTIPSIAKNAGQDFNNGNISRLYNIIRENIPPLASDQLSADAQAFIKDYQIQLVHSLETKVAQGKEVVINLKVSDRANGTPYNGWLPVELTMLSNNQRIKIDPSTISRVSEGNVSLSLYGYKKGASFVTLILENQILYALPVIVE